jgi:hypothetical protein
MNFLPNDFAKQLSDADYVNDCIQYYLSNKYEYIKPAIKGRLLGLKAEWNNAIKYPELFEKLYSNGDLKNNTGMFRSYLRLASGYNLLHKTFSPSNTGFQLYTEKAFIAKQSKSNEVITSDHIFGTTTSGVEMFTAFKNSDFDLEYMLENYIPETMYQHIICEMLKSEHQETDDKPGVARGKHTLDEKILLNHYKEVGIITPLIVDRKERK